MSASREDKLIRHGTIMMAATIVAGIFNYAYHIVMSRMLGPGPDGYAVLFSLFALFMMISLPANTIQTVISKYIASFKARGEQGKMSYLLKRAMLKIVSYVGILLVIYLLFSKQISVYLNIKWMSPVVLMGFVLFCALVYPMSFGALQGLQRFVGLGGSYVIAAVSRMIWGLLLVYLGFGVNGAIWGSLLSVLTILIVNYLFLRDVWSYRPYDMEIGKSDIYRYIFPVAVAYICFGICTYVDAIIVKHYFKDSFLAGYYSMVSMIGKAFLFLPMSFAGVMFPKVSHNYALKKETRQLLSKSIIYSLICCAVGVIVCNVFPRLLVHILLRRADITANTYAQMIPLFRLIGFAVTPYGLLCIVVNYQLARQQYDFLPFFILGVISQIVLLVLFHETLMQVLAVLFVAGLLILIFGTGAVKILRTEYFNTKKVYAAD